MSINRWVHKPNGSHSFSGVLLPVKTDIGVSLVVPWISLRLSVPWIQVQSLVGKLTSAGWCSRRKKKERKKGKGNTCYATPLKKSQNNYAEGNQPDKRLHTTWFHSYEMPRKAKLYKHRRNHWLPGAWGGSGDVWNTQEEAFAADRRKHSKTGREAACRLLQIYRLALHWHWVIGTICKLYSSKAIKMHQGINKICEVLYMFTIKKKQKNRLR